MSSFVRVSLSELLPGEPVKRVLSTIRSRRWNLGRPYWPWNVLFRLRWCLKSSSPSSDRPVVETVKRELVFPELDRMLDEYMDLHHLKRAELLAVQYLPGTPIPWDEVEYLLVFWKRAGYPRSFRTKPDGSCSRACRPCVSMALRLLDSCCELARETGRWRQLEDLISLCRNDSSLRHMLSTVSPQCRRLPKFHWLASKWLALDPLTKADVRAELQTVSREISHPAH